MLEQFLIHIQQKKLCARTDKILLAVSGGVDSMVMLHLFSAAGFTIAVAHCNFQLRGAESMEDEALVCRACEAQGIPFYGRHFETETYAREKGISIQMAARELRYAFFNELAAHNGYNSIATAHHLNDSLETVLVNLVRGTGLDGLTGIPVRHQNVIRPLLFATREMIEKYAAAHQLSWRDDASNQSDKYTRNLLRNQVIPLLKKINPALEEGFNETLERLAGASCMAGQALEEFRRNAFIGKNDQIRIGKNKLMGHPWPAVLVWELIKDKGFKYSQCKLLLSADHQAGKVFYSPTHQLTVDRDDFIISERSITDNDAIRINSDQWQAQRGKIKLAIAVLDKENFKPDKNPSVALLDPDILHFPLTWRTWKAGDHFIPLGMSNSKKISNFLIDAKVPLPDKDHVTVLESAGEIAWVVGFRIGERFKVRDLTKHVLEIRLIL